ncbi:carbohydrate ABC transporter ATP-binding protein (CUT1 family) [Rhizobium subbaraonis]|uniref:Carbohydrate ABC transporter ATP-binding protein (CUT1 family) n=1 Tax=Rhizobium subbaraonis TaxID=908946 RepID=A0A285U2M0_9HYPH|nr:ABC transporter ATP-binding protein [Rhizobium subbaraonis]SOC35927.1 carbohydrate ABC transporter ATP-binding protein (CUT1 family) [Rhizobium subbaraonis]
MAGISFRNVTKRYGKTVAVKNASFDIQSGEFFCFFGPPLSGKSTILKLILGLETPDEGEVLIGGKPVNHVAPASRNVAMVFQNLALFPHMTAAQNIRFPLVERKVPEATIKARVDEVAAKLHIAHLLHKPPAQLSGGERQRVAIARALVRDPVAYLMDDPISALDARLREETRVELKRIQRELGQTLIYVTHDQEEAMSVADRMAIMEDGEIRQIGTPVEIYDRPASRYVAQLLGAPMMNLMAVDASGLEAGEGTIILPGQAMPQDVAGVGIRPEDLKVEPWAESHPGRPATVYEVEPLGGYTVVTLDTGGQKLRALMRGQPDVRIESAVALSCNPERIHFFGAAGEALRP